MQVDRRDKSARPPSLATPLGPANRTEPPEPQHSVRPFRAGCKGPSAPGAVGQRSYRTLLVAGLFTLSLSATARATLLELEQQGANYLFRFFSDADEVHVASHYGFYDLDLEGGARLSLSYNHERITVPGVAAPAGSQEAVDAITTASRPISGDDAFEDFTKSRNELRAQVDRNGLGIGYYVSRETDYFAQQVDGSISRSFFEENTTVSGEMSYGWDRISPLADDDTHSREDRRRTVHGSLVLSQVLSPKTVAQVGAEIARVEGLQHNPYRNVYAAGGRIPERHPDERERRDLFVRLNRYLVGRSSAQLEYRFYEDDWGVGSQTIGAKVYQYIGPDVVVRHRYRYYSQEAADFYRDEYALADGVGGYRTADYRLREMDSHLFGSRLDLSLGRMWKRKDWLEATQFSVSYERYFNDENFSANVFEMGFGVKF